MTQHIWPSETGKAKKTILKNNILKPLHYFWRLGGRVGMQWGDAEGGWACGALGVLSQWNHSAQHCCGRNSGNCLYQNPENCAAQNECLGNPGPQLRMMGQYSFMGNKVNNAGIQDVRPARSRGWLSVQEHWGVLLVLASFFLADTNVL